MKVKRSNKNELPTVNKLINKIKYNQYTLRYQPLDLAFKIVLFTVAAFGNLSDGGSQGGHVILLVDKHIKSNLIRWQSKIIKSIVSCTLAAETIAMMDGVESAIYISVLLKELHPQLNNIPTEIYTDNKSLHDALQSQKYVSDKCLKIENGALKEMLHKKVIKNINWVKKEHKLANSLIKIGGDISLPINTLIGGKLYDPE